MLFRSDSLTSAHQHVGEAGAALAILTFGMIAWRKPESRSAALAMCVAIAAQAALGLMSSGSSSAALHALIAQMLIAGAVGCMVALSRSWSEPPRLMQDYGWPSLRSLSVSLPTLIGLQVALGAFFRQGMLGLMPHVIGAMLVSMFIMMVGAFVLQQCKDHKALSGSGRRLIVLTFVQVFLGIADFVFRSMPQDRKTHV